MTCTEEDTFNRLRRTPFHELRYMLVSEGFLVIQEEENKVLTQHGWTLEAYRNEWRRHFYARTLKDIF